MLTTWAKADRDDLTAADRKARVLLTVIDHDPDAIICALVPPAG